MQRIKTVLTKRWYAWEDARQIVAEGSDPELRFDEKAKIVYTPEVIDTEEVSKYRCSLLLSTADMAQSTSKQLKMTTLRQLEVINPP